MLHGFSVINIHYLGLYKKGQEVWQRYISQLLEGGKLISIVNGKKDMVQSDQPSYTSKNLRAEGQPSPPVSTKHMQYICKITLLQI